MRVRDGHILTVQGAIRQKVDDSVLLKKRAPQLLDAAIIPPRKSWPKARRQQFCEEGSETTGGFLMGTEGDIGQPRRPSRARKNFQNRSNTLLSLISKR